MSKYNPLKTVAVASLIAISSINLFACTGKSEPAPKIQVEQNATSGNGDIIKDNEQKPSVGNATDFYEYKQITTNENGVKIYGKIVTAETASPTAKKVIQDNAFGDKMSAKEGWTYTYSEYYSEAYGGTVYLKTNDKNGGQEIYNENGDCFASGKAVTDMEKWLANYRLGNAIAGAMDKKYKGK